MLIEANNLFEAWIKLNEQFMMLSPEHGMHIPSRDYTRIVSPVRLHVCCGFGFDGSEDLHLLPPFYANYENRIKLLSKRYIQSDLWEEGIGRLQARQSRFQLKNPLSFVLQFHRRATTERKVPAGGGCLTQLTFIWINGRWSLHVTLRASEITAALMGDLVFVEYITRRVCEEVRMKNWDSNELEIVWDIALASQMKAIIPLFLLYTGGDENVWRQMFKDPDTLNEWHGSVVQHFWDVVIYPERITWHQRRRWSTKLLAASGLDWNIARDLWVKEYNREDI